jgi:drug/metabolite transporter (DMT)-like permease
MVIVDRETAKAPAGMRPELVNGLLLVAGAALLWSSGGAIARGLAETDNWTIVTWRGAIAAITITGFLLIRDGGSRTLRNFEQMGWPGLGVACCYSIATICFVQALSLTTVANILLIQAAVPLLAALLGWLVLRERIDTVTWTAIIAVIVGVAIMVSSSLGPGRSPLGEVLAMIIAVAFAAAMVLTRRFAHVQLVPATALGVAMGAAFAATQASHFQVSWHDLALLFAFGGLTLGLGLCLFTIGARFVPAALTALVSTIETVLGPLWVWLVHGEVPGPRTLIGGAIILMAIVAHILWQARYRADQDPSASA